MVAPYEGIFGHTNLGAFDNLADFGCKTGVEIVGTVTPTNYTGLVVIRRTLLNFGAWDGSTPIGQGINTIPRDDTSNDPILDNDPQSGGSSGKVYDLDAPGAENVDLNHTFRIRQNLSSYAVLDSRFNTVPVSTSLAWYSAVSCTMTSNGPVLNRDIPNDNKAAVGTVNLSYNLQ